MRPLGYVVDVINPIVRCVNGAGGGGGGRGGRRGGGDSGVVVGKREGMDMCDVCCFRR